jgi:hypothetical protein
MSSCLDYFIHFIYVIHFIRSFRLNELSLQCSALMNARFSQRRRSIVSVSHGLSLFYSRCYRYMTVTMRILYSKVTEATEAMPL